MFSIEDFYSQTEACARFKLSPAKFKELINSYHIDDLANSITLFTPIEILPYKVGAIYFKKTDFELAFEKFENGTEKDRL